jgi:hypothetical protein
MAKKPPKNPVTDEHAQQFSACVVFWSDVLGLSDWRITVSETRSKHKVMAEVYKTDLGQRSATIRLGADFVNTEVTERTLSDTALHECLHIFLYEWYSFIKADAPAEDIDSAEHRIINILERRLSDASPLGPQA